jgi:hypothetical protein
VTLPTPKSGQSVRWLVSGHQGRLIADSKPAAVAGDAAVIKAYLGEKFAARFAELEPTG